MATIRPASVTDLPALRTVCALAYAENPLIRWALPDDATRPDACAAWLGPSLERYLAVGRVDVVTVDDATVGLAAWRLPGVGPEASDAPTLPRPAGVLRALVGEEHAAHVLHALRAGGALAPVPAGPYLNYLAVHPAHQGRGLGGALLRHGRAATAARAGTPWLATSDPRNVPFYERHGFEAAGAVRLGRDGPMLEVLHAAP